MTSLERLALLRAEEQYESGSWRNDPPDKSQIALYKPNPAPGRCVIVGCHRLAARRGLCWMHYMRDRRESHAPMLAGQQKPGPQKGFRRKYVRETT